MKPIFLIAALALLTSCATLPPVPAPPEPNACAVWSLSAAARLGKEGVWAVVLSVQYVGREQRHAVCVFRHSDGNLWCYDPAFDNGQGNYGGSYNLWTTSRDPLVLARCISRSPVRSAQFL